jgi:hypothetical protein
LEKQSPVSIITKIRDEIEASKGSRIWDDYVNALKLISQVVFTRSSGFILEFIQNAEDSVVSNSTDLESGALKTQGYFRIRINPERIRIDHNGIPFSENDVRAVCGIRSSKKPEKGTLGYLGIGFKSVFKVTDSPQIYSGGFQFKFDRNFSEWKDPGKIPWHVIPLWISKPAEAIDPRETTFIVPFRDQASSKVLLEEARRLRRIEIIDETTGITSVLESLGETPEGITTLKHDGQQTRFKFFRQEVTVPDNLKNDRLTQEYRAGVKNRAISIAFSLDVNGNLAPLQAGAMYGGVYSFLPLGESRSGAKFPIQADFLVQPGRDAINYESEWNHWLTKEVTKLCKSAIGSFKKHPVWKYQFLSVFEFTKSKGLESYDKLFGPELIEPIEKFIDENEVVPTTDESWEKPSKVIRLNESENAVRNLVSTGLLKESEIASAFGGDSELKLASAKFVDRSIQPLRKVERQDFLKNIKYLESKLNSPETPGWFRNLYLWLAKNPTSYKIGRSWYTVRYHDFSIVLSSSGELKRGGEVWLPDLPSSDRLMEELAKTLQKNRIILHPKVLAEAKDDEERKAIRGFLTGFTGVQILDSKIVCKEVILPKLLTNSAKPEKEHLLKYTSYCKNIISKDLPNDTEIWVLTKDGEIRAAKETLLPKEFAPEKDWETNSKYLSGIYFVSPEYIAGISDEEELNVWTEFFQRAGVKSEPTSGVEDFAVSYAMEKLDFVDMKKVEKRNFGYDLEGKNSSGRKVCIEVKGLTTERDIELTGNETEAADNYQEDSYLCVVTSIPENPAAYLLRNPSRHGKKEKLTITVNTWKKNRIGLNSD